MGVRLQIDHARNQQEVNHQVCLVTSSVQGVTIPDMCYANACRYSVIFVSLSKRLNVIFSPLTLVPPIYTSRHKIIVVDFVNNNYWIKHMHDGLGTRKMKLGNHPNLVCNLICNTIFVEKMYLL